MPRAVQSLTARVLEYFKTQPLEVATEVLALCSDEVRGRRQKSEKAKQRSQSPTVGGPGPAITAATPPAKVKAKPGPKAKAKATGAKKSHKKKVAPAAAPTGETEPGLPMDDLNTPEPPDLGETTPVGEEPLEYAGVGGGVMPPPGGRR